MADSTQASSTTNQEQDAVYLSWKVWQTADNLEAAAPNFYPEVTSSVVKILREWGAVWGRLGEWQSLLNKRTLQHEVEESIVALHHLLENAPTKTKFVAADICGGKGLFSFLLSYLRPKNLERIILLEKADINWHHIDAANASCVEEGRPPIEIWPNTNLHDYDDILDRLLQLPYPVAMTGIHLCKQLGPSFCGLINGLGAEKCVYACLAPCCLPRIVTTQKHKWKKGLKSEISVQVRETVEERHNRLDYMKRREQSRRGPTGGPCFLCYDPNHGLLECELFGTKNKEEQIAIRQQEHAARVPCWKCGELGHFKADCLSENTSSAPPAMAPPVVLMDVSNILEKPKPFQGYCQLLADTLENRETKIVDPGLKNSGNHQAGNWNSERKSIFIIVR
jgi:hypothetical protein